jgi:hypothetical protein
MAVTIMKIVEPMRMEIRWSCIKVMAAQSGGVGERRDLATRRWVTASVSS